MIGLWQPGRDLGSQRSGNSLPTSGQNLSVPSARVKKILLGPWTRDPIGCPETSVRNYRCTLRNILGERRSHHLQEVWIISYRNPYVFSPCPFISSSNFGISHPTTSEATTEKVCAQDTKRQDLVYVYLLPVSILSLWLRESKPWR